MKFGNGGIFGVLVAYTDSMVFKRACLLSCRNKNKLNGSSAVKIENLTLGNLRYATEWQCQLFKCILLGHLKLGDEVMRSSETEYALTCFTCRKKGVLILTTVQGSRLAVNAQISIPKATEKQQLVKPMYLSIT